MKYDAKSRQLLTDEGELIKQLHCPLHKTWNNLLKIESHDMKRHCCDCQKDVLDISSLSEEQVIAVVQYDPEVCVCIRSDNKSIQWERRRRYKSCMHSNLRMIKTARSEEQMNLAAQDGFMVLVLEVKDNPEICSKIGVFQDKESQRVEFTGDYRCEVEAEEIGFFWYDPDRPVFPVAAYIVPKDIEVGEQVYIPDLIENIIASKWNQGDAYRRRSATAIWNGEGFDIEPEPISYAVG